MASINGAGNQTSNHAASQAENNPQLEYRRLPSVDALLQVPEVALLSAQYGDEPVLQTIRTLMSDARSEIAAGGVAPEPLSWPTQLDLLLSQKSQPLLRPVINATGVIIHTNLGRAPLSKAAREAVDAVTRDYNNLEYDLEAGKRGSRYSHATSLLTELTGAEDALVVNNCASAVFLALSALCSDGEVIISRGQLVEIGGGFRIPDVLRQSGAHLVEVGTTNRTHVGDFREAITDQTKALMRIHSSNFRLMGFVTMPELAQLVEVAHAAPDDSLAQRHNVDGFKQTRPLVIDDLGSGTLIDTHPYGLAPEPTVQESVAVGADVIAFSGDKLLGGPQAGILVGRGDAIAAMRSHPLARALRVDKMTLAALEATLRSYVSGRATEEIPIWRMISMTTEQIQARADLWQARLQDANIETKIWVGESAIGGGSLPGETLPTAYLALDMADNPTLTLDEAAARLRRHDPPVVCRIQHDHLLFDPRTVLPTQEDALIDAIHMLRYA